MYNIEKYSYRIWDKKTDIKGVSPDTILNKNRHLIDGDVFIVSVLGIDTYIENLNIIRINLNMINDQSDKVIEAYIESLEAEMTKNVINNS